MSETASALLPLFRSEHQMRILAEVFWGPKQLTGSELARRTGIPQPTVAREVARLSRSGVVTTVTVGTAKTIAPNPNLPYSNALRQLLAYAGGIIPLLAHLTEEAPGIDEVFIFGSWANRFHGETGPPPNDIDVAIVSSTVTRFDLAEARLALETSTGLAINMFVLEPDSERLVELRDVSVPVQAQRIGSVRSGRPTGLEELHRHRMHQVPGTPAKRAKDARATLLEANQFRRAAIQSFETDLVLPAISALHESARLAVTAVATLDGFRFTNSAGAHEAVVDYAFAIDLVDRSMHAQLDQLRDLRHQVNYPSDLIMPPKREVEQYLALVDAVLAKAMLRMPPAPRIPPPPRR